MSYHDCDGDDDNQNQLLKGDLNVVPGSRTELLGSDWSTGIPSCHLSHTIGSLRFLSHLDVTRVLSRAFRRARIPTAYSRGFHPMPKMAFGPALPVGIASRAEFLDLETTLPLRHGIETKTDLAKE